MSELRLRLLASVLEGKVNFQLEELFPEFVFNLTTLERRPGLQKHSLPACN